MKRLDLQQAMMRPVMRYLEPVPRKTGRRVRAGARQWARALGSERSDLQATTLRY